MGASRIISILAVYSTIALPAKGLASSPVTAVCNYPTVQQMFDLSRVSLDGCAQRLASLTHVFGDAASDSSSLRHQTVANRFLTANLVFTGRATHVRKSVDSASTAYSVVVRPACYLKGRPPPGDITLTGLVPSVESGLCLPVNIEAANFGMFFATRLPSGQVVVNENGFAREGSQLEAAWRALRCRQNEAEVKPTPAMDVNGRQDATGSCRLAINDTVADCTLTLEIAREILRRKFIEYEPDLKPECQLGQEAVMNRLVKRPVEVEVNSSHNKQILHNGLLLLSSLMWSWELVGSAGR